MARAFEDGFLLLRRSGTESMLRIYAEAPGPDGLARRLEVGRDLLLDQGLAGRPARRFRVGR